MQKSYTILSYNFGNYDILREPEQIDPDAEYTIDKNTFASKGRNTPFHGRKVKGRIVRTICGGKEVYRYDK